MKKLLLALISLFSFRSNAQTQFVESEHGGKHISISIRLPGSAKKNSDNKSAKPTQNVGMIDLLQKAKVIDDPNSQTKSGPWTEQSSSKVGPWTEKSQSKVGPWTEQSSSKVGPWTEQSSSKTDPRK